MRTASRPSPVTAKRLAVAPLGPELGRPPTLARLPRNTKPAYVVAAHAVTPSVALKLPRRSRDSTGGRIGVRREIDHAVTPCA